MHAVSARPDRAATALLHDSDDARFVVFRISPGQSVPPHRNASSVTLVVLDGMGIVSGANGERIVSRGDLVTYDPHEVHGMRAASGTLELLAIIAPRQRAEPVTAPQALALAGVR
jgi:quercetin dioxygenase-like cupin family protein